MAKNLFRTSVLLVSAALALSLSACSASPEDNEKAACEAYSAFTSSVADARSSLSASSSIADITGARDEIKSNYEKLKTALDKVGADRATALKDAWTTFDKAVTDIDPKLTVPEAIKSVQPEVAGIEAANQNLETALSCS